MTNKNILFFLYLAFMLLIIASCEMNSDEVESIIKPVFTEQPVSKCITKGESVAFSCNASIDNKVIYYKWFETNKEGNYKIPVSDWTESSSFETAPFNEKGIHYYVCAASTVLDNENLENSVISDIVVVLYSELPIIVIDTVNSEEPTAEYVSAEDFGGNYGATLRNHTKPGARMRIIKPIDNTIIYDSGEYVKKESGLTVKLRGNTSAYENKKPYKLKLQKKDDLLAELIGRNDSKYKDKEWILLANAGIINTFIGLTVSDIVGTAWTPDFAYVNLIMNGEYRGIYMLIEAINQSKKRINVADDGYIIERDAYWWNEDVKFTTDLGQTYTFKYPDDEDIQQEQIDFIHNYMNSVEEHIQDGTYENYIDTESFARWILIHDILGTWDACGSNIYMTKYDSTSELSTDENGEWSKLEMSTPWDFDLNYYNKDKWSNIHTQNRNYADLLFNNTNTEFVDSYKSQWSNISNNIWQDLQNSLSSLQTTIGEDINISRSGDAVKWKTSNPTIEEDIANAVEYFTSRIVWLENAIGEL